MRTFAFSVVIFGLLVGCAATNESRTEAAIAAENNNVTRGEPIVAVPLTAGGLIDLDYLGKKAVPVKTTVQLPLIFNERIRVQYPQQKISIRDAVGYIFAGKEMPIRFSSDVYYVSGQSSSTAPVSTVVGVRPPLPSSSVQSAGAGTNSDALNVSLNFLDITRQAALNNVCAQANLSWQYKDGVLVISRLIARDFVLKVQPGMRSFEADNSKTATSQSQSANNGGGGQITSGISSNATVKIKTKEIDALDSALAAVRAVLTPLGKASADSNSSLITVIDSMDGIERAEQIMDRRNEILGRIVKLHIKIVSFQENDNSQKNVDWSVAFQNFGKAKGIFTSPTSIANSQGGSITASVIQGTGAPNRFDGSSAFLTFLNNFGKTHTVYEETVRARNRVATATGATQQTVYLAATTPATAAIGGSTGGVPGLTPGSLTTGLDMQIQPNILDSGQLSVLISLGVVDKIDILTLTSGTGANQQSIQGPETSDYKFLNDATMQQGETIMISSFEKTLTAYAKRTLDRDMPWWTGGGKTNDLVTQKLFIFVTPVELNTTY